MEYDKTVSHKYIIEDSLEIGVIYIGRGNYNDEGFKYDEYDETKTSEYLFVCLSTFTYWLGCDHTFQPVKKMIFLLVFKY